MSKKFPLFLLLFVHLVSHLFFISENRPIAVDGYFYISGAREILNTGNIDSSFDKLYHPGFSVVIALFSKIFQTDANIYSLERFARLLNIGFSAIFLIFFFLIVQCYFGLFVGICSSFALLLHPLYFALAHSVLSEPGYYLLFLLCCVSIFFSLKKETTLPSKLFYTGLTGITTGLAYLFRPEMLIYLIFFTTIFIITFIYRKYSYKRLFFPFLVWLVFTAISLPYLLFLNSSSEELTLSNKISFNFKKAESVTLFSNNWQNDSAQYLEKGDQIFQKMDLKKTLLKTALRFFTNLHLFFKYTIIELFPAISLIFLGIGIFFLIKLKVFHELSRVCFLCLTPLSGIFLFFLDSRFFFLMIPLGFLICAIGIEQFSKTFSDLIGWQKLFTRKIILSFVLIIPFLPFTVSAYLKETPEPYKECGTWIRTNMPEVKKIYARLPFVPYYSGTSWKFLNYVEPSELYSFLKKDQEAILVLEEKIVTTQRINLLPLFTGKDDRFFVEKSFNEPGKNRIVVLRVR